MNYEDGIYLKKKLAEEVETYIDSSLPVKYHIYDSCTFTVPYDTIARVIAVGKGGESDGDNGGGGGGTAVKIVNLKKGKKINVTINDTSTVATYNDQIENWTITGNAGSGSSGGTASGGDQNISGGGGGSSNKDNAISKGGSIISTNGEKHNISFGSGGSTVYGGGASYFGGNGGRRLSKLGDTIVTGNGGDGLYGGGDGGTANGSHTIEEYYGGDGGEGVYGCGGNAANYYVWDDNDSVTLPVMGQGGKGYLLGGKSGDQATFYETGYNTLKDKDGKSDNGRRQGGKGGFLGGRGTNSVRCKFDSEGTNTMTNYTDDVSSAGSSNSTFDNYPAQIPMVRPIGSGQGSAPTPGVGAVIIEFGVTEVLETY